jgi:hypothetical protein
MPLTNYWSNLKTDHEFRAQADPVPASWWAALLTAASRTGGTRQTAGGVVALEITSSLANWAGTQGAGTTTSSSGTSRTTSNNGVLTFAAAASAVITATHIGLYDGDPDDDGTLCRYYAIKDGAGTDVTRTWQIGDPVKIEAAGLLITQE